MEDTEHWFYFHTAELKSQHFKWELKLIAVYNNSLMNTLRTIIHLVLGMWNCDVLNQETW